MTNVIKKPLSLLLALLICIGVLSGVPLTVSAVETGPVYFVAIPRGDDPLQDGWGHPEMPLMNGWQAINERLYESKSMDGFSGNTAYCIEVGINLNHGDILSVKGEDFWDHYPSALNNTITPVVIKSFIGRIMQYGWTGQNDPYWSTNDPSDVEEMAELLATQLLIWETVIGERDINFSHVAVPAGTNRVLDLIGSNHPLKARIYSHYDRIVASVQNHSRIPSFCSRNTSGASTYDITYNGSGYSVTLTDTNNVLGNYNFTSSTASVTFSVSGNKLTINMKNAPTGTVKITAEKKNSQRYGIITWTDGNTGRTNNGQLQDVVTYGEKVSDPVSGFFDVKASYGSAKIVKTSEDGKVNGITFTVSGNGINKTVTTNASGQVQIDNLVPGVYTVTEQSYDKYVPQESRQVTVVSGQTATVTFNNTLRRGNLTVTKSAEDGLQQGMKFHLYGTSLSGASVNEYAVVGADGKAYFQGVLIGKNYTLEEVDVPDRYIVPDTQKADIEWNKVTEKSFDNRLKKWNLTVTKNDSETGSPQGDGSLAGAVYGIYKGEEMIDSYTTDVNGQFATKWYICDNDWWLQEISPSEGYLLDETIYPIGAEAKNYTVEYNPLSETTPEDIIKGKIALIKHTDDGSTQIETPEVGAEFEVFLKRAGSYANAKATERDNLICDEYGFSETKELPYGVYTVKQVGGWEGKELLKPFDVYISQANQTYRYIINNREFESYVKIVKTDAETGKTIPYAGAGFKIYDTDGNLVTMTYTYPEVTTIDTFYTTEDGYLITSEMLPYGLGLSIVEVQAPYGYVLNSDPIYFDITEDNSTEESAVTVVVVTRPNMPQKGKITIGKTGEVFSTVFESGEIYQPVYEVKGLSGAVYKIRAAEDIYTPDGTLRYAKGTVVDTVTTTVSGFVTSKALYLGKYEVQEITAPYGMLLNHEIHTVELTYAGQLIEITETATDFYNERQKVQIDLNKVMEQNEIFGIGNNGEILSVQFGLFAAENLVAADGTFIPKDGLIEIVNCDETGYAEFSTDLPVGAKLYVKEIATDSHYVLSETEYPVVFEYAGQDVAIVSITVNDGEAIDNDILYGTIKGLKIDRETEETIAGAVFGLFYGNETEYTEDTAILTAISGEDGVFLFENIPFGDWIVVELMPAEDFLPNNDIHHIYVNENEEIIEITVVNDRIPEIGTTATTEGKKETHPFETITIEDVMEYKHLIPGKEYTVKGILMDKSTGESFLVNGEQVVSEVTFVPEAPSGEVVVTFTFDGSGITVNTDIVVFEGLYKDEIELTVHADVEDDDQTVTILVPKIDTTASVNGAKEVNATDIFTLEDVVHYENLIPGKEYILTGVLMDKNMGAPLLLNGEEIRSEVTFTPETSSGDVFVTFVFDSKYITADTDLVIFEKLLDADRMNELANHEDMESQEQTVTVHTPKLGTQATVNGEKEVKAEGEIIIEDVISYTNLTPSKEYTIKGLLMNKATGEAFKVNGQEIHSEVTFIPETPDGEITVYFTFDASGLTVTTEVTAFERLYYDGVEIACHTDIEDEGQTVKLTPPPPSVPSSPQTGDNSHLWLWATLALISGSMIILFGVKGRRRFQ
ncbi:MAG: VaFE repeat-containing surface-anchored protein [Clostridiales bacterium]|nr:VaFE repeat-containing surface-anchored protein [Clostridiales bacterium]